MLTRGYNFGETGLNIIDYTINIEGVPTVLTASGTGATGTATCITLFNGTHFKKHIIYLNNYKHTGTTGQTYTFPTAHTFVPAVIVDATNGACTVTTTSITLPANMTSAITGWIILEGY